MSHWPQIDAGICRVFARCSAAALIMGLASLPCRAQVGLAPRQGEPELAEESRAFGAAFGFEAEKRALDAGGEARQRALQRLWSLSHGAPKQVAQLLDAWLSDSPKLGDVEAWLTLRVLTSLPARGANGTRLGKALSGELFELEPNSPYAELVPRVAALALASSAEPEALSVLGEWLRRPSRKALYARDALLAHPPSDISPLLSASGGATVMLMETLGSLKNPAATALLRRVVKRATADVQAAAAIALAQLGVRETQDLATLWASRKDSPPPLLRASSWIALHFSHPERRRMFLRLTELAPVDALSVAEEVPRDVTLVELTRCVGRLPDAESRDRALAVISALGELAAPALLRLFDEQPSLRWQIARYLPQMNPATVLPSLEKWARDAERQTPALAALGALGAIHSLDSATRTRVVAVLKESAKSAARAPREAAKASLAWLDEGAARHLLSSDAIEDAVAAALASALHGPEYRQACVQELHRRALTDGRFELSANVRALSTCLAFAASEVSLSRQLLTSLANSTEPFAETARARLWERTPPAPESWSSLATVQARTSWALAQANWTERGVFEVLEALATEPDGGVRRALVQTLQAHPSPPRAALQLLSWTAQFDPDPAVRLSAAAGELPAYSTPLHLVTPEAHAEASGYWATITRSGEHPVTLYFHQTRPTLVWLPPASPRVSPKPNSNPPPTRK